MGIILILMWMCGFLLVGAQTLAQDAQTMIERRGVILAMNRPLDSEAERLFTGVVSESVRGSLERQKLGVVETTAPSYQLASFNNPTDVLDSSTTEEVDFILLTEYASRGQDLEIRMAWYDPQSGEKTEEVIRRGRKDLVLDKIIREALNELLVAVESSLEDMEPRQFVAERSPAVPTNEQFKTTGTAAGAAGTSGMAPGWAGANGTGTRGTGPGGPGADGPGATIPTYPGTPERSGTLPSPLIPDSEIEQQEADPASERKRHFEFGVGCAPFVATGAASEYFKIGVMPVVNLSYLFQGKLSRLGLGLYGGWNRFSATGNQASAETFLIPMGVSLRYEIGSERYPGVVFGLASGPALMMMDASTDETLTGLTFFGRGILGVRLPIGGTFALLVEAGYDVYWEQPQPIMGFSPAVSTTIRL
jgi:hypothetical protein